MTYPRLLGLFENTGFIQGEGVNEKFISIFGKIVELKFQFVCQAVKKKWKRKGPEGTVHKFRVQSI